VSGRIPCCDSAEFHPAEPSAAEAEPTRR
jgi:hypothetical protein